MGDSIRTESFRNDQAKIQLEHQNDKQLKDLREKHKNDLERVIDHQATSKRDLEKAYEVTISAMKDDQEKKLEETRLNHAKQLEEEKRQGEEELEKVKSRYHEQIARYRENSEKQLEEIRLKTDTSAETLRRARERGKS